MRSTSKWFPLISTSSITSILVGNQYSWQRLSSPLYAPSMPNSIHAEAGTMTQCCASGISALQGIWTAARYAACRIVITLCRRWTQQL